MTLVFEPLGIRLVALPPLCKDLLAICGIACSTLLQLALSVCVVTASGLFSLLLSVFVIPSPQRFADLVAIFCPVSPYIDAETGFASSLARPLSFRPIWEFRWVFLDTAVEANHGLIIRKRKTTDGD
jgi:hypothetical protein